LVRFFCPRLGRTPTSAPTLTTWSILVLVALGFKIGIRSSVCSRNDWARCYLGERAFFRISIVIISTHGLTILVPAASAAASPPMAGRLIFVIVIDNRRRHYVNHIFGTHHKWIGLFVGLLNFAYRRCRFGLLRSRFTGAGGNF
jgi:hypothetical protein